MYLSPSIFRSPTTTTPRQTPRKSVPVSKILSKAPDELKAEIRDIVGPGVIFPFDLTKFLSLKNCGYFLQNMQPFRVEKFDDHPQLRKAFHDAVLKSLKQFCSRIKSLRLYKFATVHYKEKSKNDPFYNAKELMARITMTIQEVQGTPNMRGVELAERCKRITEWKKEIKEMAFEFPRILMHFERFVNEFPNYKIPKNFMGNVEVFNPKLIARGWYEDILFIQDDHHDDALELAQESALIIKRGMEHDNKYLDVVLSPLEGHAGPKKITRR
jgi:hypothetical protein